MFFNNKNQDRKVFGQDNYSKTVVDEAFADTSMEVKRKTVKKEQNLSDEVKNMFAKYADIVDDYQD